MDDFEFLRFFFCNSSGNFFSSRRMASLVGLLLKLCNELRGCYPYLFRDFSSIILKWIKDSIAHKQCHPVPGRMASLAGFLLKRWNKKKDAIHNRLWTFFSSILKIIKDSIAHKRCHPAPERMASLAGLLLNLCNEWRGCYPYLFRDFSTSIPKLN